MTAYRFRKAEEWKSALMLLPDSSFFDLMRSIFGNIKTPFNKQRLVENLFVFLSRDDIRNTIASYLDEQDLKIIAAVSLLDDPAPEQLEDFFQGSMNFAVLRGFLNNLEERLIIYRFKDEAQGLRRLALNPVLESILAPLACEWGILFPAETIPEKSASADENHSQNAIADDRTLAALFAFIGGEEEFYRAPGIRKKVMEQGKRLFPDTDLEAAAGSLHQLGLFTLRGEQLFPMEKRIRDFGNLAPNERREYWAAGYYLFFIEEKNKKANALGMPGFPRNRAQHLAVLIHQLCSGMDVEKLYPGIYFYRSLFLMEKEDARSVWRWQEKTDCQMLLDAMETAGIIEKINNGNSSGGFWKIIPVSASENSGPVIAMDSAFSFILYPGISFANALDLAAFSSVKEDNPFCFELSRASVVKGFNQGISAETMIKLLREFSGNRIDENLEWTLKDWESRYAAVSLHEGLILSLSEERQYLAKTKPIASYIKKTLAPGLYLLSGERQQAIAALEKAGVDIIAQPNLPEADLEGRRTFPSPDRMGYAVPVMRNNSSPANSLVEPSSSKNTQEQFKQQLNKMTLPKAEKDELLARIERRVIVTGSQLEKASIKFEKLEARGIDYQGKTIIAKQAIADGSLVEVTWPNPDKGMTVDIGYAQALEKKEGDSILVLKLIEKKEGEEFTELQDSVPENIIRIPLGKISLLKRLKQSIFGE